MKILLDSIGKKHDTDKSSLIHNYCVKYEKYLPFDRSDKIKILEIGVLGGNSLRMWQEFYYRSEIIGIDINPDCKRHEERNITIEIGHQADNDFLSEVIKKHSPFDMILDDGSHINSDVITSFEILFPSLKSGGVYIVEDSCTAYWTEFGGAFLKDGTSVEYFKRLIDDVNFMGFRNMEYHNVNARREDVLTDIFQKHRPNNRTDIESINFLNSIILITKR